MRNQDNITIRFGVMMRKKTPVMTVKTEEETNVRYFVEEESMEVMSTNTKDEDGGIVKGRDLRWIVRG